MSPRTPSRYDSDEESVSTSPPPTYGLRDSPISPVAAVPAAKLDAMQRVKNRQMESKTQCPDCGGQHHGHIHLASRDDHEKENVNGDEHHEDEQAARKMRDFLRHSHGRRMRRRVEPVVSLTNDNNIVGRELTVLESIWELGSRLF